MIQPLKKKEKQGGQTLVETVAAVFILAMGISSALGLAVYAFSASTNITKQIVATGLAREGAEAVKNMRDTNWLKQISIDKNCYNFIQPTATTTAVSCPGEPNSRTCCYKNWLSGLNCASATPSKYDGYCINPSGHQRYRLKPDLNSNNREWVLENAPSAPYNLYQYQSSGWDDENVFQGLYQQTPSLPGYALSEYSREILLITDSSSEASQNNNAAPFNTDIGPQLEIVSRVWWTDKKCPASPDWPGLGKCSVEIRDILTNWKNY